MEGSLCRVSVEGGGLVVDRRQAGGGTVPALVVVEAVAPVDHRRARLGAGGELVSGQDLPLQAGEERLGRDVVEARADPSHDQDLPVNSGVESYKGLEKLCSSGGSYAQINAYTVLKTLREDYPDVSDVISRLVTTGAWRIAESPSDKYFGAFWEATSTGSIDPLEVPLGQTRPPLHIPGSSGIGITPDDPR